MKRSVTIKRATLGLCLAAAVTAVVLPSVVPLLRAQDASVAAKADVLQEEDGPHPLQGKPAPAISVDALDGGKFDLADHQGKVVIIDFWASWCGPCVRGLPVVTEVAKAYADQGVVFYAMNVQEDAATIKPFLKKHKLDVNVALDTDGKVSEAYGVQGIPQTVIIGKDGVISKIHVGFSPKMKKILEDDVKKALEGKNDAPKP
jgi:thiol-disulfide isomerase/thioredoxin